MLLGQTDLSAESLLVPKNGPAASSNEVGKWVSKFRWLWLIFFLGNDLNLWVFSFDGCSEIVGECVIDSKRSAQTNKCVCHATTGSHCGHVSLQHSTVSQPMAFSFELFMATEKLRNSLSTVISASSMVDEVFTSAKNNS